MMQVMSVNLFGVIRVTNAFLPLIRKSQGRIVNVSSIMARMATPFAGSYSITKNAIDSYSAILRLEMKRFNVKVVVIEPGNFMTATNFSTCNGQGGFAFNSRRMWDQLDEKIQNDYGLECLEREISISQKLVDISVSSLLNNKSFKYNIVLNESFFGLMDRPENRRPLWMPWRRQFADSTQRHDILWPTRLTKSWLTECRICRSGLAIGW
jgi:short-subunit dehydrogenase